MFVIILYFFGKYLHAVYYISVILIIYVSLGLLILSQFYIAIITL